MTRRASAPARYVARRAICARYHFYYHETTDDTSSIMPSLPLVIYAVAHMRYAAIYSAYLLLVRHEYHHQYHDNTLLIFRR